MLDRAEWIKANVASFQQMFRPLEEVYIETLQRGAPSIPGMTQLSRAMLSGQVGLLLGFLARKVLGQYDISLLGHEPIQTGKLYFVEPNIRLLRKASTHQPTTFASGSRCTRRRTPTSSRSTRGCAAT